jgi:dolichyl-phosphate beta-glucosyltransferase
MSSIRVVLPVYNELRAVPRTWAAVAHYARENEETSFCFVDDGSTDGTAEWLEAAIQRESNPRLQLIANKINRGKGHAIAVGFAQAGAEDYLIFTDGDLAYSLSHLPILQEKLDAYDVVIGSRELVPYRPLNTSFRRKVLGRGFNALARGISGLPYRDTQAGLKGFRAAAARRIFSHKRIMGFGFDVELLFLAHKYGLRVAEVQATVEAAHSYKTSKLKLMRDSVKMLGDLGAIRWHDWSGHYE